MKRGGGCAAVDTSVPLALGTSRSATILKSVLLFAMSCSFPWPRAILILNCLFDPTVEKKDI